MSQVHSNSPLAIIGYGGQLGTDLKILCTDNEIPNITVQLEDCDFRDIRNVRNFFPNFFEKTKPSIIINASAYTAVDRAEDEKETAFAVNRDAVGILAQEAHKRKVPFIHYSTDYVFDGTAKSPYLETDKTNPLGVYGKSKLESENEALQKNPDSIIIRTAWLYGLHGNNFIKTMHRLMQERETLKVVSDQLGCPTWSMDLAEATLKIISTPERISQAKGNIFHYCGSGETSWHGFAMKIREELLLENIALICQEILPISTAEYPTKAKRPAYSVLNTGKISALIKETPPVWQDSLKRFIHLYKKSLPE